MIETDYIVTCSQPECEGGPTKLHSLEAFGPTYVGRLWKLLNKAKWTRVNAVDTCPACAARLFQRKPATATRKKKA